MFARRSGKKKTGGMLRPPQEKQQTVHTLLQLSFRYEAPKAAQARLSYIEPRQ